MEVNIERIVVTQRDVAVAIVGCQSGCWELGGHIPVLRSGLASRQAAARREVVDSRRQVMEQSYHHVPITP